MILLGQPTEWEKIFVNDITNKELISNTYICVCVYTHTHIYMPHMCMHIYMPKPKEGQCRRMFRLPHNVLISQASEVMLKIIQVRLQQYMN